MERKGERMVVYRFGMDVEQFRDVKALAQAIADGRAAIRRASVTRSGSVEDYMETTLTVTFAEPKFSTDTVGEEDMLEVIRRWAREKFSGLGKVGG